MVNKLAIFLHGLRFNTTLRLHQRATKIKWYKGWHDKKYSHAIHSATASVYATIMIVAMVLNLASQNIALASWQHTADWGTDGDFLTNASTTGDPTDRSNVDVADGRVTLARSVLDKVETFDAGANHSMAITTDGKVYSTGQGQYGKLGTNATTDSFSWSETQNASTTSPAQVAAGGTTSLLLKSNGAIASTGVNSSESGGNIGTYFWSFAPLSDVAKIAVSGSTSAGNNFALAIDKDKNLWVTGYNANGQLGLGDTATRSVWTKTSLTNVVDISAGVYFSYAVVENQGAGTRTLYVAGYNGNGQLGIGNTTQQNTWYATTKTNVQKVEASKYYHFGFYIDTSGNLFAAGTAGSYQLGTGNTTQQNSWIQTNSNIIDVSAGYNHTLIVKSDGTVWSVGSNNYGQLGLVDTNQRTAWAQTSLSGATAVSCGQNHTLVLLTNLSLWGFGYNNYGQLGTDDEMFRSSFANPGLSGISAISSGSNHSVVLGSGGKIYSTGQGQYGKLGTNTQTDGYSFVETQNATTYSPAHIATGSMTSFVVNSDGTLVSTGYNNLDSGGMTSTYSWVGLPPGVTKISASGVGSASSNFALAIDKDKNLWATGFNSNGQLGLGDTNTRSIWTKTSLTNVVDISAGYNFSYAIVENVGAGTRTLYVAGYNGYGQLGIGNTTQQNTWYATSKTNVQKVEASKYYYFGFYIDTSDNLFAAGNSSNYQLGMGDTSQQNTWVQSSTGVIDVSSGQYYSAVVKSDNTVWVVGLNNVGQLGLGDSGQRTSWTQTSLSGATAVSCGQIHTLVLISDGTIRGTGYNIDGELGLADNANKTSFYDPGLTNVANISAGSYHSLVVSTLGKIYSTGQGQYGKLGTGNASNRNTFIETQNAATFSPSLVESGGTTSFAINTNGTLTSTGYGNIEAGGMAGSYTWAGFPPGITKIAVSGNTNPGYNFALAIDKDKNLWVTGFNSNGQLGLGDTVTRSVWTKTSLTNVVDISAGMYFSYAVVENQGAGTRTLYVAGYNNSGQLGIGNTTQQNTWYATTKTNVQKVEASKHYFFGFYTDTDGNLFAAGTAGSYQLGKGNTTQQNSWIQTNSNVIDVSAGYNHTLIVKSDGTVWSVGSNNYGQLGLGDIATRTAWTQTSLAGASSVSCGQYHTLVLLSDGTIRVAGYNLYGNLGTDDYPQRVTPAQTITSAAHIISPFPYASSGYVRGLYLGGETPIVFYGFDWSIVKNANSNVKFRFRHADAKVGLATADWSEYFEVPFSYGHRVVDNWFEFELSLYTSERQFTPQIDSFTALYYTDALAPNNPTTSDVSVWDSNIKTTAYTTNTWHNDNEVYFEWTAPTDNGESGVAGYYVYFGDNQLADPVALGAYQAGLSFTGTISNEGLSGDNLYLCIRTVDNAGNVYTDVSGDYSVFVYRYDIEVPSMPVNTSVSPIGWTLTNNFRFDWEAASDTAQSGESSGVMGYEYKLGEGEWISTGAYFVADVMAYQNGQNKFYVRSIDNAGNRSAIKEINYYFNGAAPTAPQNLTVTPQNATENNFTFSWDEPASFNDSIKEYRYSINVLPSEANTTSINGLTVGPIPAATQQGLNDFYIVAVDIANNVNYSTYARVSFECNTPAPGIPLRPSVTDFSDRLTEDWKLVASWQQPSTGGSVAKYRIERAIAEPENEGSWTEAGTATTTTFAEAGLDNELTYFYRIIALDNAGAESAPSEVVSKQPTGKYTTPPTIVSGPTVKATAVGAVVNWVTNRATSSFVEYSVNSSFNLSNGSLPAVTEHEVVLSGLTPGTTYQYRVQSLDEQRDYDPADAYSASGLFKTSAAPGISEVVVSEIRLTSAIITWKTTSAATSKIMYGKSNTYGSEYTDNSGSQVTTHTVKLSNLSDSTPYYFKIIGTDIDDNLLTSDNYVFTTLTYPRISGLKIEQVKNSATSTVKVSFDSNVPTTSQVVITGSGGKEVSDYSLKTNRSFTISGLADNTNYQITVRARDEYGNEADSQSQAYKTEFDTRPPAITGVSSEVSTVGVGTDTKGQAVISWETDEPATSQVEYAIGVSGDHYDLKTQEDTNLTTSHIVIITGLKPSTSYHFRTISKDAASNIGYSEDNSVLTEQATNSVLDLIVNSLESSIGWLFGAFSFRR